MKYHRSRSNGSEEVRVADNGAGIPASDRERVFERFQRTNDPAFRHVAGTGLGLYISRQLAEGHGGSLAVESSTPGDGSVFVLALPILLAGSSASTLPSAASQGGDAGIEAPAELSVA